MVLPGNSTRTLVGRGPPPASTQQVGQRRPRYRSRRRFRCRLRRRSPPLLAQEIPTGGDRTVRSLRRTGKGMSGRQRTSSKPNPTTSPPTTTSRPDTPTEPLRETYFRPPRPPLLGRPEASESLAGANRPPAARAGASALTSPSTMPLTSGAGAGEGATCGCCCG